MKEFIKRQIAAHPQLWEIFKFLVVGGLATIVDFFVMAVVMYFLEPGAYDHSFFNVVFRSQQYKDQISWYLPMVGTAVGFLFGLVFNYIFSVVFVFKKTDFAKTARGATLFVVLAVIGFLIHVGGMALGTDVWGFNYWLIKVVLTIFVLIFNYLSRKILIFK